MHRFGNGNRANNPHEVSHSHQPQVDGCAVTEFCSVTSYDLTDLSDSDIVANRTIRCLRPARLDVLRVLVADSNQMQSQLLVNALRRRRDFEVFATEIELDAVLGAIETASVQVAILNLDQPRDSPPDMAMVRRLHMAHPDIPQILLLDHCEREVVVSAFRSGAKGIFCFSDYPFRLLCKCIRCVHRGEIWANTSQVSQLVQEITQVPSLRTVNSKGLKLLTPREEQVVALVADGLSNRETARELSLSENTIKKYLFRIFDKLGISSRVELVLFALSHGGQRDAEWVAGQQE